MRRPAIRKGRERGMALVMAIVIALVCLVIVAGLMQYVISEYRATHLDWRRVQALYCAEAGVEAAVEALKSNPTLTTISETTLESSLPGATGSYEVSVTPVQSAGVDDPLGAKQITATGYVPSKAEVAAGRGVDRRVVVIYGRSTWDFGFDAVRARQGVEYGSNNNLTVVVDSNYNIVNDPSVDASIRVTGEGATIGSVSSTAANKAHVAGTVSAPGTVDVNPSRTQGVFTGPDQHVPNAFPDAATLGYDAAGNLVWPPVGDTWAANYYQEALAGGTIYSASGTIVGPKYIELGGSGTLSGVTLRGPGTIFVHGNMGDNVTNGAPPATLVVSGNFTTTGNTFYRYNPAPGTEEAEPALILFGETAEIKGNSTWYLNGPLYALNPTAQVRINDSAITCFGALVSNGTVKFKSSKGALGFPQMLKSKRFTLRGLPMVLSYAAQ